MKTAKRIFSSFLCAMMLMTAMFSTISFPIKASDDVVTIIDDADEGDAINQIQYSDGWYGESGSGYFHEGTYHWGQLVQGTDTEKISYEVKFYGKKIELFGSTRNWYGKYQISIDGEEPTMIDAYSESDVWEYELYDSGILPEGEHVLYVEMNAADNDVNAGTVEANVDYLKVYSSPVKAQSVEINEEEVSLMLGESVSFTADVFPANASEQELEWSVSDISKAEIDANGKMTAYGCGKLDVQVKVKGTEITDSVSIDISSNIKEASYLSIINDAQEGDQLFEVKFDGIWGEDIGYPEYYHQGDSHWSNSNSFGDTWPSYTISFIGTKIELYGNRDCINGIYEIFIDGVSAGRADIYTDGSRLRQQKIFESEILEDGQHTIEVRLLQDKHPGMESAGYEMSFDFAKVYHNDIPLETITFEKNDMMLEEGMSEQIEISLHPSYTTHKNVSFTYSSDDPQIASVNEDGIVTALHPGKTRITAGEKDTKVSNSFALEVIEQRGNLRAAVVDTDHHHYQDDFEELSRTLDLEWEGTAWRNDEMISEIAMTTLDEKATDVRITASDFVSESGDVIGADAVSINYLRETMAFVGHGAQAGGAAAQPHISVPDIIYQGGSIDIEAGKVQPAWINIKVAEDAKPGKYSGELRISSAEQEDIILQYRFEVLDLVAPSVDEYEQTLELWEYPLQVAKYYGIEGTELFGERHMKILEQNLKPYQEAGGSVAYSTIVDCAWGRNYPLSSNETMVIWYQEADGSFSFDYTRFDKWIALNEKLGIADKIKLFAVSSDFVYLTDRETGEKETFSMPIGSTQWYDIWSAFLQDFIPHLEEKGWADKTYFAVDEIGEEPIKYFLDLLEKNTINGKKLKFSAAVNYSHMSEQTMDQIDDISISLDYISYDKDVTKAMAERRNALGLQTSFYTCVGTYPNSFALNRPADSAWTIWYNFASGLDGYLRWAYDNWTVDPYVNLDYDHYEAGDTMLVYPDPDPNAEDPTTYSTPRFENLKQAKRDVEKLNYLMKQNDEIREKAQEMLDSLDRSSGTYNAYGGKYASTEEDAENIVSETQRMREGLVQLSKEYLSLVQETDKTKLSESIAIASALDGEAYTINSWNTLISVLETAQTFVDDDTANQEQIDDAAAALNAAMDALQVKASDSALNALQNMVGKAEALESDDEALNTAIETAQALLNDPDNASVTAVVSALLNLSEAMQALNTNEGADALREDVQATIDFINENILNDVEGLRPGKVQALKDAVQAAQTLVDDPEATADELKAANKAMTKAAQELWEIVAKAELEALIEAANGYLDGNYTAESLEALQAAITAAQAVAINDDATTAEVTEAITNLSNAIAGLEAITLDTSALGHEIDLVNEMLANLDDYVLSSVEGLADKLADAQNVLDNATSQAEIDEAVKLLREARLNARTKADVSALEKLIAYAKSLDLSGCTTDSAQAVIQTLARVEQMTNDPEITQEEVDDMVKELQVSVDELVEVNDSTNAEDPTNTSAVNTTNAMFALMIAAGAASIAAYRRKRS